ERTNRSTIAGKFSSSQVLSMGRISSLTSSSTVRPRRGCAVWASVLNAASSAAVVAGERRPSLLGPCPAAEASEKDRSVGPAPLLGAGDATGSLGESSCIAGIAPSSCGGAAALGGLSCSSSAIIRRMEARISANWLKTPLFINELTKSIHLSPQIDLQTCSFGDCCAPSRAIRGTGVTEYSAGIARVTPP